MKALDRSFGKSKKQTALTTRLAAYSATAGAALLAPAAHAAVVNITSFNLTGGNSNTSALPPSLNMQLASNQLEQFSAGPFHVTMSVGVGTARRGGVALGGNGSSVKIAGADSIAKLGVGDAVTGSRFFTFGEALHVNNASPAIHYGLFFKTGANAATTGYFALRTGTSTNAKCGFLRLRVQNNASGHPATFSLVDLDGHPGIYGAYGLASDDILAGEVAVPEPSTEVLSGLGLLALGAVGVRELRRRRAHATPVA